MSGPQFRRDDQVDQFPANSSFAPVTEKTLSRDVPFADPTVITDDDDAIESGIENGLIVLFAGSQVVLPFAGELPHHRSNKIVEELVNERFGFSPRQMIEFLDLAGET